ncbi:unnamed protein product [Acanthosepion pharaonis]|uniref:Uncharacterized protein n=1 Tax=Acanthosepion pharaonis TaxID=158019 RepID=A0A812B117_ACAPH|nr:unnamed protein product [Sepia pharaonis]
MYSFTFHSFGFYCLYPFSAFRFEFIHRVFFHISLIWFLLLLSIFRLSLGGHSSCILSHFTHFVFTATFHFPPSSLNSFIMYSFHISLIWFLLFFPFFSAWSSFIMLLSHFHFVFTAHFPPSAFDVIHHVFFHISLILFIHRVFFHISLISFLHFVFSAFLFEFILVFFSLSLIWFLLLLPFFCFPVHSSCILSHFTHLVFYCLYPFRFLTSFIVYSFTFHSASFLFFSNSFIMYSFTFHSFLVFTASFHFPPSSLGHSSFILSLFLVFTASFHFVFRLEVIHHLFFPFHSFRFFTASFHFPLSALTSFIISYFTFHSFCFYCFFPHSAFRFDFIHHLFFHILLIPFLLLLSIFRLPL